MAKVYSSGRISIDMSENLKTTKCTVGEFTLRLMGLNLLDNLKMIYFMDWGNVVLAIR